MHDGCGLPFTGHLFLKQTEAQSGFEFFTGALEDGPPHPEGAQDEVDTAEEGKDEDERETSTLLHQVSAHRSKDLPVSEVSSVFDVFIPMDCMLALCYLTGRRYAHAVPVTHFLPVPRGAHFSYCPAGMAHLHTSEGVAVEGGHGAFHPLSHPW